MKRLLMALAAILLASFNVNAQHVTEEQALQKAQDFLNKKTTCVVNGQHNAPRRLQRLVEAAENDAFYIFNIEDNDGFVIVSSDNRTVPILGYSYQGHFDMSALPQHVRGWLDEYATQLTYLQGHSDAVAARKTVTGSAVSPLLGQTEWNQYSPYNDLCPLFDGLSCPTGCEATAMAQIMYYHRWPEKTTEEIPSYSDPLNDKYYSSIPAGATIRWNDMLPQYTDSTPGTEEQRSAVAELMAMCGKAVKMQYTFIGSSASTPEVATALKSYFDYDATVRYVQRRDYNLSQWNQLIYDELVCGRPVLYSGRSLSEGGHAFVIDGYDRDDYFHVNWGWGGQYNGYFLLSVLCPYEENRTALNTSTFHIDNAAVIGIQKNIGTVIEPTLACISFGVLPECSEMTRNSADNNFSLYLSMMLNHKNTDEPSFEYAVGVFDDADNLLSIVSDIYDYDININGRNLTATFGAGLADGVYRLKAVYRAKGSTAWMKCELSNRFYILATISGNTLTAESPIFPHAAAVDLEVSMQIGGEVEIDSEVPLDFTIVNRGVDFNDDIYIQVDGQIINSSLLQVDKGKTATLHFSFTPTSIGDHEISLLVNLWDESINKYTYKPVFTTNVNVLVPSEAILRTSLEVADAVDGTVTATELTVNANLSNIGLSDYDGKIRIRAAIMDGYLGGYLLYAEKTVDVQVPAQQNLVMPITLDSLENGDHYLDLYYLKDGEWVEGCSYHVNYLNPDWPVTFDMIIHAENVVDGIVTDSKLDVNVSVSNVGETSYDGKLQLIVYKKRPDEGYWEFSRETTNVHVSSHQTVTVPMVLDYLEDGDYLLQPFYLRDEEWVNCRIGGELTFKNTIQEKQYAVFEDGTLTFYFDTKQDQHPGTVYNVPLISDPFNMYGEAEWQKEDISKVVFDTSFAHARPRTTRNWFYNCRSLNTIEGLEWLNTEKVTDMWGMFSDCSSLTSLDMSGFNTEKVTTMYIMFSGCSSLTSLDLGGFNTENVTDMRWMFSGCSSLTNLDLGGFNTENVTDMTRMFQGCSSLTNLDLSGFNTENVTNMDGMFAICSSLTNLDLTRFNTEKVTDMNAMFAFCSSLTNLDLSGFNTEKVTDMRWMFQNCSNLTTLDLSRFNTEKVTTMRGMFSGCSGLKSIFAGNEWSTDNVANGTEMFSDCYRLVGGAGTEYDWDHTDHTYAHIDGGASNPGYFTDKNSEEDAIENVKANENNRKVILHEVSGRKLPASQKGINIIRMNDGTVKKVLIK